MDSDALASMYGQIVRGVAKEDSHYVTDEESGRLWDQIAAEVEQMRADNPEVQFEVPNEVPEVPDAAEAAEPEGKPGEPEEPEAKPDGDEEEEPADE